MNPMNYLTPSEYGKLHGISYSTVRRRIAAGVLPFKQCPKTKKITIFFAGQVNKCESCGAVKERFNDGTKKYGIN
jgi:hypothetical protein